MEYLRKVPGGPAPEVAPMELPPSVAAEAAKTRFQNRAEAMVWVLKRKGVAKIEGKPVDGPDSFFNSAQGMTALSAFTNSGLEYRRFDIESTDAIVHVRLQRARDSRGELMPQAKGAYQRGETGWAPQELVDAGVGLYPEGDRRHFMMKTEEAFAKEQAAKTA
jgi:hypothetical protein